MDYIIRMQILNALYGLGEEFKGLSLAEDGLRVLMVEEISPIGVLHDHMNALLVD